jgi:hypothetical protein
LPIGRANNNPILDTRMYKVEYPDGHKASLAANTIAENMFALVDDEGNRHIFFEEITDHRTDGTEVRQRDAFLTTRNGNQRRRETMKGWEILIQWKDGSSTWVSTKDVKTLISGAAGRVCNARANRGRACIRMVDSTCHAQEEQDHREAQDQVLGQDSHVLSQDPKDSCRS